MFSRSRHLSLHAKRSLSRAIFPHIRSSSLGLDTMTTTGAGVRGPSRISCSMRLAAQSNWHPDAVYATFADGTNAVRSKWPCLGDA
jgi:hypothetical protein